MHKRSTTIFVFGFLLFASLVIFLLGKIPFLQPISGIGTFFTAPLQQFTFSLFHFGSESAQIQKLQAENTKLLKKLIDQKKLLSDDAALRDQFKTNKPTNNKLLPANVIGAPGFIPGISQPQELIINVGSKDGVSAGQAVVVTTNLIGKIEKVSYSTSVVLPIQTSGALFTAKTVDTNAVGMVNSLDSGELQLGNVLLSDTLHSGDLVVTKGDIQVNGKGFPPDLLVGKIISIDKRPSDLFQTAKIVSLVDLSKVSMVFVAFY